MGAALDGEQVSDVELLKDVEQPKDVGQAQRGGTGPQINHTCSLANLASLGETLKKGGPVRCGMRL